MELLKKKRACLRTAVTKALNNLNLLLDEASAGTAELTVAYGLLSARYDELEVISARIIEDLQAEGASAVDIEKEYDDNDVYSSKFLLAKYKFDSRIARRCRGRNARELRVDPSESASSMETVHEVRKAYNLPKIELVKFGGNVREWLQFWSMFKKLHEDTEMENEVKFQYLIQAMIPDSRAASLVKSYPPTGENYQKAIDGLKKRFGRDDIQIEVYVRELLQLVLQNAVSSKKIQLASLYDKIESYLRALETLGVTTDKCAAMLFPLVESSLPEDLLRAWQRLSSAEEVNDPENSADASKNRLSKLIKFLESEVQNELRISLAVQGFGLKDDGDAERPKKLKGQVAKNEVPTASSLLTKGQERGCIFCGVTLHESAKCHKARNMTMEERQDCVKRKRACFKCLKVGHISNQCRVYVKCAKCSRRHVNIMCLKDEKHVDLKREAPIDSVNAGNVHEECSLTSLGSAPTTFMQTLRVKLRNNAKEVIVRAVIDTGSQNSYILKGVASQVGYKPLGQQNLVHLLFGGDRSKETEHAKFLIHVGSLDGSYWCNFLALDQDMIYADVPTVTQGSWLGELARERIKLSDVDSKDKTASVLIGADVAGKLLTGRVYALKSGLTAVETRLGWTLMGKVPTVKGSENLKSTMSAVSMFVKEADIKDLWALDVIGIRDPIEQHLKEERERAILQSLMNSVVVNDEGRYEVSLPWLEKHPALNDNKSMAINRLQSTTRSLKAAGIFEDYNAVFEDWLAEGVIERVPIEQEDNWGRYLPHRAVIKENSTTAIRSVFDASAKEKGSPSINDCVEKGPNLIELVTTSLLHFREGEIGVVADIKKAFLQISLKVTDRDFLHFLWYDKLDNMIIYRHCRVVFGVSCSPFILGAVINMHLENALKSLEIDKSKPYSRVNIKTLKDSFYVDNCVTSVNSEEQLCSFINDAKAVMESARFELRGWEYSHDNSHKNPTGVLGILWDKDDDMLSFNMTFAEKLEFEKITKRSILSVAHRIFDPLGFVAPVTLCPRLLLQETWAQKLSWDEEVSGDIKVSHEISLHTFCDASKDAYAAVVFLRVESESGIRVNLVQAKSRIAATRKENSNARASIPRLELLAATIGARLTTSVLKLFKDRDIKVYYWSDSSTVLTWIHRESNWTTFVWNRVKEIRSLSPAKQWRHVPSHLNPADLPSRGCAVGQLISSRWWEGPEWLKLESGSWPAVTIDFDEQEANKELKKSAQHQKVCTLLARDVDQSWFSKFSDYGKVKRVLGWVIRFCSNLKLPEESRVKSELTCSEIEGAEIILLGMVQEIFKDGENDTRIKHLQPFRDNDDLLRLKTKIILREDSYNFRCPIVLPGVNDLVALIIKDKHVELKNAGVEIFPCRKIVWAA